MNREVHVRICGRLGVKFPGPTRRTGQTGVPAAIANCRGEDRRFEIRQITKAIRTDRAGRINADGSDWCF